MKRGLPQYDSDASGEVEQPKKKKKKDKKKKEKKEKKQKKHKKHKKHKHKKDKGGDDEGSDAESEPVGPTEDSIELERALRAKALQSLQAAKQPSSGPPIADKVQRKLLQIAGQDTSD